MKKLRTTAEAAKQFNITSATINNWINQYNIDCYSVSDNGRRLLTEDNIKQIKKIILEKYNLSELQNEND